MLSACTCVKPRTKTQIALQKQTNFKAEHIPKPCSSWKKNGQMHYDSIESLEINTWPFRPREMKNPLWRKLVIVLAPSAAEVPFVNK